MRSFFMENKHVLTLDSQKVLSITNALEVLSFSDREIRIKLKDNTVLTAQGSELKITCFDDKNGTFTAVGNFTIVKYRTGVDGLIKRVLK
ncbi:MAG: hypothetical protein E7358_06340 [Clostridiales bacterium]|nr:hypothetical protein [Clostridiales bacterium]